MSERNKLYDPFDPSNKPGYEHLPEGLSCRNCPGFNKYLGKPGEKSIKVECGWPDNTDNALIVPDPNAPRGGGWLAGGTCRSGKLSR